MRDLFLEKSNPCFNAHLWALRTRQTEYIAAIRDLGATGAMPLVSGAVKAKALAALHTCSMHDTVDSFLPHCEATDIAKALTLLDRPRAARQLCQRIQQIENQHPNLIVMNCDEEPASQGDDDNSVSPKKRKNKRKLDVYRKKLKGLEAEQRLGHCQSQWCSQHQAAHTDTGVQEQIESTSVSGALSRRIRAWAKNNLKADFLEFVMLSLPTEPWRKVADLVHFKPCDFALPYFLADVFGNEIPQDSFVARMRALANISDPNELTSAFLDMARTFPAQVRRQYSYLRTQPRLLSQPQIAENLAETIPLETVLWYFEELYQSSRKCAAILKQRLEKEENSLAESLQSHKSKATYGKLVERILKFKRMGLSNLVGDLLPLADRRLSELKELHHFKAKGLRVAVFGDNSSSMQAAVEAATIFASMVSTCLDGELSFFNGRVTPSPYAKPQNVTETLKVCHQIRAGGCTSLAAALWPYHSKRKEMDLFVMVTDEEENTNYEGFGFASLLALYKKEVNPNAQLIVVTVGNGDQCFRRTLRDNGIVYKTVTIDEHRADLTKFDGLLGQIAAMSPAVTADENEPEDTESSSGGGHDFVLV